ncbi:MAG TPA: hypothetical protein P5224_11690 [Mesotoga sp.]|nr:hypothetical protein [Mesotoga sp.]
MTILNIVKEIFESLGEPSDLDFWNSTRTAANTSSVAWKRLVDVVNEGCLALSSWKWPNGRQIRMRHVEDVVYLKMNPVEGVCSGVLPSSLEMAGLADGTNLQAGKLLVGEESGATGIVLWSSGTTLMLTGVEGSFVEGEKGKLYQREWKFETVTAGYDPETVTGIPVLAGKGAPIDVIGVYDVESGIALGETERQERYVSVGRNVVAPSSIQRIPRGFVLDTWPLEGAVVAVRFTRGPGVLGYTDTEAEPELPPQFHWGLVLWGKWWGLQRSLETNDAYAVRKDLESFMSQTRTEYDFQDEFVTGQMKAYPEGR